MDGTDGFSWPWAWYLRDYHDVSYAEPHCPGFQAKAGAVFLINHRASSRPRRPRPLPGPVYASLVVRRDLSGTQRSAKVATSPPARRASRTSDVFFLYRRPGRQHGCVDGVALFPLSLVPDPNVKPVEPESLAGRYACRSTGPGAGPGELEQPGDVFVDVTAQDLGRRRSRTTASSDTTRKGDYFVGNLSLPVHRGPTVQRTVVGLRSTSRASSTSPTRGTTASSSSTPRCSSFTGLGAPGGNQPAGAIGPLWPPRNVFAEDGSRPGLRTLAHKRLINYSATAKRNQGIRVAGHWSANSRNP